MSILKFKTNHSLSTLIIHMLYRGNSQLIHPYFLLNLPYGKSESPKHRPGCTSISGLNTGPLLFQARTTKPAPNQLFSLLAPIPLSVVLSPPYPVELVERACAHQFERLYQKYHTSNCSHIHQNSSLRQSYRL